ncbi:MAG: hypothetical protein OXF74_09240 [Rhodobacteraceae bacterium]|nr:hypothetical protein [Paracoccaceae bacterium]
MNLRLPPFLRQGEAARLFPVLSTTSKEGRTTAILLACMARIDELSRELLAGAGQRVGTRTKVECYTEIVPASTSADMRDRPDGVIVLRAGKREWKAFVEAKIGNSELDVDQIERYRNLARENDIDCVITISNQFATAPTEHPLEEVRKSRSRVPVIHWSWMHILTTADLLVSQQSISSHDQLVLLNEFRRFLAHESAGVRGFDRMPREWTELNRLVSAGGDVSANSHEAAKVLEAWHQETRDLSLALSRLTETQVTQRLPRSHQRNIARRQKDELLILRDRKQLTVSLEIPDAAAPLDVVVDLARRCIDVGMTLEAPEDRKSSKARVNWLLRQIKQDDVTDLYLRVQWRRRSASTQHSVSDLRDDSGIVDDGTTHLEARSFHLFESKRLGARFTQQSNFIADLEQVVPSFYGRYGAGLIAWQRPAPTIKGDKTGSSDVSPESISEEADSFVAEN